MRHASTTLFEYTLHCATGRSEACSATLSSWFPNLSSGMSKFNALIAAAACVACASAQACTTLQNTALVGYDIDYALLGSSDACCSACSRTYLCSAWTWSPDASQLTPGSCFLKTAVGQSTNQAGFISGTVNSAKQSTCPFGLIPCNNTGACSLYADWCETAASCSSGSTICPDGVSCSASGWAGCPALPPYLNSSLALQDRVALIVSNLTVAEIAPQLNNEGYGSGPLGPPGTCDQLVDAAGVLTASGGW